VGKAGRHHASYAVEQGWLGGVKGEPTLAAAGTKREDLAGEPRVAKTEHKQSKFCSYFLPR